MRYLKPLVNSVYNLCFIAESQYIVGLVPDGSGCPTVLFNGDTGTGVVNIEATFTFAIKFDNGQSCNYAVTNVSGQATFQNGSLVLNCSSLQEDCNTDFPCGINANEVAGEVCLDSLTINGEAQNAGICIELGEEAFFDVLGQTCPR